MRPANQQQAELQIDHLIKRRIKGSRARVWEHRRRARQMAAVLWNQYRLGPYQYHQKHLHWYLNHLMASYSPETTYRHWLTVRRVSEALWKDTGWLARSPLKK